jgi:hypothetical protein
MEIAEYAFAFSIALIFFSGYLLIIIPPKEPPKVKKRREASPSPPPPEVPDIVHPYNEDVIISLMIKLYTILINLGAIKPDDIVYLPASGHHNNTKLCESLHLVPRVISLMKRLPYPAVSWDFEIIYETRAPVYTEDREIEEWRDPDLAGTMEDLRLDYLAPTDIALTIGGLHGKCLVLDTEESLYLSLSLAPDHIKMVQRILGPTQPAITLTNHSQIPSEL